MKTNLTVLLLLALISSFANASDNQSKTSAIAHLDPKQILLQCHDPNGPGPIGIMRDLTHPNGQDYDWEVWEGIAEQVRQGNADWIRASGCLAHGARYGGCASCYVHIDWAYALATNTRAILELYKWIPVTDAACNLPFIEEDEAFLAQYMDTVLANLDALASIPEDYTDVVQNARRACTWSLKASYLNPNRCKFNGEEYLCPEVKQNCKFNGENYYDCKSE